MSSEAVTGFFGAQCVCRACKPTWPSHPPGPRTLYTVSVAPEGLELRSRSLWSVPRGYIIKLLHLAKEHELFALTPGSFIGLDG